MGNFLDPAAFAFLGLLPVIVLFYVLKLRRKEVVVSSTFLWKKSVHDLRVNAPFQKLRQNLLLFLQLIILALVVFALARPFLKLRGFEGQSVILLVDTSGSMKSTDVLPNRLEAAKAMALEVVDDMSRGDKMMIITFDVKSATVASLTTDRGLLRNVIRALHARDTRSSIREALNIAQAAASTQDDPEIIIISDGHFPDLPDRFDSKARVSFISVGKRSHNVGIVGLEPRRNVDVGQDYQIFAKVANSTEAEYTGVLECLVGGQLTDARELKIPKGQSVSILLDRPGISEGVVQARIKADDDLAVDDEAFVVLAPDRKTAVLHIGGTSNYFLEKVLEHDDSLRHEHTSLEKYDGMSADELAKWDVLIFDGEEPKRLPPQGRFFFLNTVPKTLGFEDTGEMASTTVLDWSRAHPVNRFVNFANVSVLKSRQVKFPKSAEQILEAEGGPLILSMDRDLTRALVVTFDLFESDWPLRLSFPLFIANAMQWLGGRDQALAGDQVATGDVYSFAPEKGVKEVSILIPGGDTVVLPVGNERRLLFGGTERVGLYAVSQPEHPDRFFAANLLDANETSNAPKASFKLGDKTVTGVKEPVEANREVWHWLAMAGLALLMGEWYIYHRRVLM